MTVAVYLFVWGMAARGGKEHTVLYVFIANTFTLCLLPTWSFPFFTPPTVSQQYPKKIVLFYHILRLNRSFLLNDDPSQTLAAKILEPSYSSTLIECVGAGDVTKAFRVISKPVGEQLKSICCNHVMITAQLIFGRTRLQGWNQLILSQFWQNNHVYYAVTMHMFPHKLRK